MKSNNYRPYKRLILWYVRRKNSIIKKALHLEKSYYLYNEDIQEICSTWSNLDCKNVVENMIRKLRQDITDINACPWCEKFSLTCKHCTYKIRHGECSEDGDDTYTYIIDKAIDRGICTSEWDGIVSFPGMKKLIDDFEVRYYAIKKKEQQDYE